MAGPCSECGSRRWRKAPGGYRVCEEGHVDRSYRKETVDLGGEPSQSQQRIRRVKRDKKRRVPKSKGRSEIYHGREKDFLYYECLQLLVRHQVRALKTVWSLPNQVENITRDLLSLCLLLYPLPPPPEQEQARTAASSPPAGHGSSLPPSSLPTNAHASSSQLRPTNDKDVDDTDDSDDPDRPRRELEEAHEDDDDDDDDEEDPADAERDPADRTDGDTDGEDESGSRASQSSKGKGRATSDSRRVMRPIDCLSIVIIACWTIKVPVMFTDFIDLINSYQLPYLEFAKSPLVPSDLRRHFERELFLTLSPAWAPSTMKLYHNTSDLAVQLHERFGIRIPELNAAPVMWKCISSLGGSPTLYPAVVGVSRMVQVHLSLHQSIARHSAVNPRSKISANSTRRHPGLAGDRVPPELTIMAAILIVFKMVYGLDGRDRLPVNYDDPATEILAKKEWLIWVREQHKRALTEVSDQQLAKGDFDILSLENADLDRYLTMCEHILPTGLALTPAQSILLSRFPHSTSTTPPAPLPTEAPPIPPPSFPTPLEALPPTGTPLHPPLPPGFAHPYQHRFESFLLPGEAYPIWSGKDVCGRLEREAEVVLKEAARIVGVGVEEVLEVLERLEGRLVVYGEKEKKQGEGEEGEGGGDGDGEEVEEEAQEAEDS